MLRDTQKSHKILVEINITSSKMSKKGIKRNRKPIKKVIEISQQNKQ